MDCGEGLIELINPEIVEMNGEQTGAEACLSFPGYFGYVKRANQIKIKSLNRQGETILLEGEPWIDKKSAFKIVVQMGVYINWDLPSCRKIENIKMRKRLLWKRGFSICAKPFMSC